MGFIVRILTQSMSQEQVGGDISGLAAHLQGEAVRWATGPGVKSITGPSVWTVTSAVRAASSIHTIVQTAAGDARVDNRSVITGADIVGACAKREREIWPFCDT